MKILVTFLLLALLPSGRALLSCSEDFFATPEELKLLNQHFVFGGTPIITSSGTITVSSNVMAKYNSDMTLTSNVELSSPNTGVLQKFSNSFVLGLSDGSIQQYDHSLSLVSTYSGDFLSSCIFSAYSTSSPSSRIMVACYSSPSTTVSFLSYSTSNGDPEISTFSKETWGSIEDSQVKVIEINSDETQFVTVEKVRNSSGYRLRVYDIDLGAMVFEYPLLKENLEFDAGFSGTQWIVGTTLLVCGAGGASGVINTVGYPPKLKKIFNEDDYCVQAQKMPEGSWYILEVLDYFKEPRLAFVNSQGEIGFEVPLDVPKSPINPRWLKMDVSSSAVWVSGWEYGVSKFSLENLEGLAFDPDSHSSHDTIPVSVYLPENSLEYVVGNAYGKLEVFFSDWSLKEEAVAPFQYGWSRSIGQGWTIDDIIYVFLDRNYALYDTNQGSWIKVGPISNAGCSPKSANLVTWNRGEKVIVTCQAVYNLNNFKQETKITMDFQTSKGIHWVVPLNGTQHLVVNTRAETLLHYNWVSKSIQSTWEESWTKQILGLEFDRDDGLLMLINKDMIIELNIFTSAVMMYEETGVEYNGGCLLQGETGLAAAYSEYNDFYIFSTTDGELKVSVTLTAGSGFGSQMYFTSGVSFTWNSKIILWGNWGMATFAVNGLCGFQFEPNEECIPECDNCFVSTSCSKCWSGSASYRQECYPKCDVTTQAFNFQTMSCSSTCPNGYSKITASSSAICVLLSSSCLDEEFSESGGSCQPASECNSDASSNFGVETSRGICSNCLGLLNSTVSSATGLCSSPVSCQSNSDETIFNLVQYSDETLETTSGCTGVCNDIYTSDWNQCNKKKALAEGAPGTGYYYSISSSGNSERRNYAGFFECYSDSSRFVNGYECIETLKGFSDCSKSFYFLESVGCVESSVCILNGMAPFSDSKGARSCIESQSEGQGYCPSGILPYFDPSNQKCIKKTEDCSFGWDEEGQSCKDDFLVACSHGNTLVPESDSRDCLSYHQCVNSQSEIVDGISFTCGDSCWSDYVEGDFHLCCDNSCGSLGCFDSGLVCCHDTCNGHCYGDNENTCCHYSCGLCEGPSRYECLTCPDNTFFNGNVCCHQVCEESGLSCYSDGPRGCCDETCGTCDQKTFSDCLTCEDPRNFDNGKCCDEPCKTCDKPDYCTSCMIFSDNLVDGNCCSYKCTSCSGSNKDFCFSCTYYSDSFGLADFALYSNQCLKEGLCPEDLVSRYDESIDSMVCCGETCQTCFYSEGTPEICKTCYEEGGYTILTIDGTCVSDCGDGYFLSDKSDDGLLRCYECDSTCKTCTDETFSDCSSCFEGDFFTEGGACIESCGSHFYSDRIGSIDYCLPCYFTCEECDDGYSDSCISCYDNDYMTTRGTCIDECNSDAGEYIETIFINDYCLDCMDTCSTCSNSDTCDTCFNEWFMVIGNTCTSDCFLDEGFYVYVDDQNENVEWCLECSSNCKTCIESPTECLSCSEGEWLNASDTCENQCGDGFYEFSENGVDYCYGCDKSCETCDGPSSNDCLSCNSDYFFDVFASECLSDCYSHFYQFETTEGVFECLECHSTCSDCFGGLETECTDCYPSDWLLEVNSDYTCESNCLEDEGYFEEDYPYCFECESPCETCADFETCLTCIEDFLFKPFDSTCVENCGDGFYEDDKECLECHYSCEECSGPDENECTDCYYDGFFWIGYCLDSCPSNFYYTEEILHNECFRCAEDCLRCSDFSDFCIACESGLFLFSDATCRDSCSGNSELSDWSYLGVDYCLKCHPACDGCLDNDPHFCTDCASRHFMLSDFCYTSCPAGYYNDSGFSDIPDTCQLCSDPCNTCLDGTTQACTSCIDTQWLFEAENVSYTYLMLEGSYCIEDCSGAGYFDYADTSGWGLICASCDSNCYECGGYSGKCTSCSDGLYLSSAFTCIEECSDDSFISDQSCFLCAQNCKTCDIYFDRCTSCYDEFLYTDTERCSDTCIDGYYWYLTGSTYFCAPCSSNCLECDSNSHYCTACAEGDYITEEQSCITGCSDENGSYSFENDGENYCYACTIEHCQVCPGDSCETCFDGWKINDAGTECLSNCGTYETWDSTNGVCLECLDYCLTCDEISETGCTSCQNGYYLTEEGSCTDCGTGYYTDGSYCFECGFGCEECADSETCLVCSDSLFLLPGGKCVTECSDGTYTSSSSNVCLACRYRCTSCEGSYSLCTSCRDSYYFYSDYCYSDSCPSGTYQLVSSSDSLSCEKCSDACLECSGNDSTCIDCDNSKVLYQSSCIGFSDCLNWGFIETIELVRVCTECDSSCLKCDVDPTFCTECSSSDFLFPTLSVCSDDCPLGSYSESGMTCYPCETGCETCGSYGGCFTCEPNYYFGQLTSDCLYMACPSGFFARSDDWTCQECSSNCASCETSSDYCISCPSSELSLLDGQCISFCPLGYFTSDGACLTCSSQCASCEEKFDNCIRCTDDYLYLRSDGECTNSCSDGFYTTTEVLETSSSDYLIEFCFECDDSCSKCSGSSTSCESCSVSYFLYGSTCVSECPEDYYAFLASDLLETNECIKCSSSCSIGCSGPQKTDCLECYSGCASCEGDKSTECLSCEDGYLFYQSDDALSIGQCLENCPSGYFSDTQAQSCEECHESCAECKDSKETSCTSCKIGYFLESTRECKEEPECPSTCETCEENSETCTECILGYTLISGDCYGCPDGEYLDGFACDSCNDACMTCSGPNTDDCTSCKTGTYLLNSTCVEDCGSGYFANNESRECEECSSECFDCVGAADQCTSCLFSDVYLKIAIPASEEYFYCLDSCRDGEIYQSSSKSCVTCEANCLECKSTTSCSECEDGFYLLDGGCYSNCPNGYYEKEKEKSCSKCRSNCLQCTSGTTCDLCSTSTYFFAFSDSKEIACVSTCPESMIAHTDSANATCLDCQYPYLLIENVCTECTAIYGLKISKSTCQDICGDGKRFTSDDYELSSFIECDDGNNYDSDGCSSTCEVEDGWTCKGGSSQWADTCAESTASDSSETFEASLVQLNSTGTYFGVLFSEDLGGVAETNYNELIEVDIELENGGKYSLEFETIRTGAISSILIFVEFDSSHRGGNITVTLDPAFFFNGNLVAVSPTSLTIDLPVYYYFEEKQYTSNQRVKEASQIIEVGLVVASAISGVAATVAASSGTMVVASGVWSLAVLSQQIAYFQMIDCSLPDHYASFASGTDIGRADFIPNPFENIEETSSTYDLMLTRTETGRLLASETRVLSRSNYEQVDPDDNTPALYRDTGFSSFFLVNSGQYLIVYILVLLFSGSIIILSKISAFQFTKFGSFLVLIRDNLAYILPIKLIRYTTLDIFIFCLINFYYNYSRVSFWSISNLIVSFIAILISAAAGITSVALALVNNRLRNRLPSILHGFFFELRTERLLGRIYPIVYLVRNTLFAVIFVFLFEQPVTQIILLLIVAAIHSGCLIPFWIIYKSFIEGLLFFIVSLVVLLVLILLLALAVDTGYEFGMSANERLGITWFIIIVLGIALVIHFLVLIWSIFKGLASISEEKSTSAIGLIEYYGNQSASMSKMNERYPEQEEEEESRFEEKQNNKKASGTGSLADLEFNTEVDELERIRRHISRQKGLH